MDQGSLTTSQKISTKWHQPNGYSSANHDSRNKTWPTRRTC